MESNLAGLVLNPGWSFGHDGGIRSSLYWLKIASDIWGGCGRSKSLDWKIKQLSFQLHFHQAASHGSVHQYPTYTVQRFSKASLEFQKWTDRHSGSKTIMEMHIRSRPTTRKCTMWKWTCTVSHPYPVNTPECICVVATTFAPTLPSVKTHRLRQRGMALRKLKMHDCAIWPLRS